MGLIVDLDDIQQALAYEVGYRRNQEALAYRRTPNGAAPPNDPDDPAAQDVALYTNDVGACAECATAKASDHFWTGGDDRKAPDVGPWEVRGAYTAFSPLTLRKDDGDKPEKYERAFILVVALNWGTPEVKGKRNRFELIGWAWGREVMVPEFWRPKADVPCWRLEQRHPLIKPITTLPEQPPGGWRGVWR